MPRTYTATELNRWFGTVTAQRGRDYQHNVIETWWEGASLHGRVQGSRRTPYEVEIEFDGDVRAADTRPTGSCTCPMVMDCKHVVAVLLVGSKYGGPGATTAASTRPAPSAAPAIPSPPAKASSPAAASAPDRPTTRPAALRSELVYWMQELQRAKAQADEHQAKAARVPSSSPSREQLAYLVTGNAPDFARVLIFKVKPDRDGVVRLLDTPWNNVDQALLKAPRFLQDADAPILRLLRTGYTGNGMGYGLHGASGAEVLRQVVASGRGFVGAEHHSGLAWVAPRPLLAGKPRSATLVWEELPGGRLRPRLECDGLDAIFLSTEPWWYVDQATGETGPLQVPVQGPLLARFLAMPAITLDEVTAVATLVAQVDAALPAPPAPDLANARVLSGPPVPVLTLDTTVAYTARPVTWIVDNQLDFALACFDYDGVRVGRTSSPPWLRTPQGELVRLERDEAEEHRRVDELIAFGLLSIPVQQVRAQPPLPAHALTLQQASAWPHFVDVQLPALREAGWQVEFLGDFRHHRIVIEALDGVLEDDGNGWFDVQVGVNVEGQRVRIEPLLTGLFARDLRWLGGHLDDIGDDERVELQVPQGPVLSLRAGRLKPLVRALLDLLVDADQGLRVSARDRGRLELLEAAGDWQLRSDVSAPGSGAGTGETTQQALAARLRDAPRVQPVAAPAGLTATLRPYQLEGLAWMQFLRAQDLGGVLADDMGLGKTVQTLAHLLVEKEAGRLDRPALVLLPTSLVANWRAEAARFAPGLRVLALHGPDRHERISRIPQSDLVLVTYPLVWRDQSVLAAHEYHLLILDEAQQVKNASTRTSEAIRGLAARHRLCLTGTPLENHLGELWSQFDFLMPGFLGSARDFAQRWRAPIEKGRDGARAQLLARRVRPFLLRRRKEDVASELPPRVESLRTVAFDDAQRDLYETVRATMHKEVMQAVDRQGLARSRIVMLDALLKLRQVCCDPRLVKNAAARNVTASAKLELLCDMLPLLVEEGRSILVFSQFTSMLALIGAELERLSIPFVTLTGETRDRETPVSTFQSGAVPVFLISLRAGGVGLNLTAADTVIHYDPWWNPAVERQATDRAHRIGQQRQVFVYKLIAAGTVEEKIMAMQERKAALADAILEGGDGGNARFTDEDLEALFAPLPEVAG